MTSTFTSAQAAEYAEVLETAADLWKSGRVDWTQAQYSRELQTGDTWALHVCAVGGLCTADIVLRQGKDTQSSVEYLAGSQRPHPLITFLDTKIRSTGLIHGLIGWNDEPGRTKQEVIDLFEQTAKDLRNGDLS